jgi:hypothetical protein
VVISRGVRRTRRRLPAILNSGAIICARLRMGRAHGK